MWPVAGTAGALGLEILLALAVGWFGGQWLDRKLGTAPWFQWVGPGGRASARPSTPWCG